MALSIVSSLFLFAVAYILRSQPLRELPLARPVSWYFCAEAGWSFLSGLLIFLWGDTAKWVTLGHYVVLAAAAGYVFYCCCGVYQDKKGDGSGEPIALLRRKKDSSK